MSKLNPALLFQIRKLQDTVTPTLAKNAKRISSQIIFQTYGRPKDKKKSMSWNVESNPLFLGEKTIKVAFIPSTVAEEEVSSIDRDLGYKKS